MWRLGLKPGEKMHEELMEDPAGHDSSEHPDIMVLRGENQPLENLEERILDLELAVRKAPVRTLVGTLRRKRELFRASVVLACMGPRSTPGGLPKDYPQFLGELKTRIREAQVKAALSVNRELIGLYWEMGRRVVERLKRGKWGASVIERLAADLCKDFPGMKGFSTRNIWRMRAFYLAWTEKVSILTQPVSELDGAAPPQAVSQLPWGHNIVLFQKLKNPAERLWYVEQTVVHGWSRSVLVHQIETGLHLRQGKALTNFSRTLPAAQSDSAQETVKDEYAFDFLAAAADLRHLTACRL